MTPPMIRPFALIAVVTAWLPAQTTVSIPADRDATLYASTTGNLANGGGSAMFAGMTGQPQPRRALLHFDVVGAIPAGAQVLAADLQLTVQNTSSGLPTPVFVHLVAQDWSEGTTVAPGGQGAGGPAQAGDVTWLHTDFPSAFWANPGGDFAPTPSFTMTLPANGAFSSGSLPGLVADVQSFLDTPSGNFGWLIKDDELGASTAAKVFTREASSPSQRPKLSVTYLAPGDTGSWGTGCPTTSPLQLLVTGPATSGNTVTLAYGNAPAASIGATFWSLQLDTVGTPVASGCSLFLGGTIVPGNAFLTDALGNAGDSFAIPPTSPGFLVVCQGAVLDGSPAGYRLSDGGVMLTQ
ncbi:MAG TPA: DNRLRE domain-containing protein [bacterium]|nr:DNRLRE domain-containing protein [bacterium]